MHKNREPALKRLEGQVRDTNRMVEEERYCVDILTQIVAVRAAFEGVEKLLIDNHVARCTGEALASGYRDDQRAKFTELLDLSGTARGCCCARSAHFELGEHPRYLIPST